MFPETRRVLTLLLSMTVCCGILHAQNEKTITLRMLDSRTGKLVLNSDFQVRVNREQTVHADWVVLKENGTGKLTLPKGATLLSVQGTYNSSTDIYVNCDSVSEKDNPVLHWYEVAEILTAGVVAPNGCVKPAVAAKLKSFANPGEFVFFVRKLNWREQMKEDYSSH